MADDFEFSNFVPGLTPAMDTLAAASAALAVDKNDTIQFEDEGVPVAAKGGIQFVNFTGAGVTATPAGSGVLDVVIPGGGGGSAASGTFVLDDGDSVLDGVFLFNDGDST